MKMNVFLRWLLALRKKIVIIFLIIILFFAYICPKLLLYLQSSFLSTAANGIQTPETYGISYERVKIISGNRFLDAYLVIAPSKKQTQDLKTVNYIF